MQPGDVLLLAIGQGLLAATPLQLAVGYSAFANGGIVVDAARRAGASSSRRRPTATPGFADLTQAVVAVADRPGRAAPDPDAARDPRPDPGRHPPQHHRARRTTAARRRPRSCSATTRPTRSRSPARRAPRRAACSYPWNDSSAFAAYSVDPDAPLHRRVVPREGRLRLDGCGAGRQVHVPRPVGQPASCSTRCRSPSRSTPRQTVAAQDLPTSTPAAWRAPDVAGPPAGLTRAMGLSMLQRKPDSGLGNIRSSPADPSRNIDWVLLAGQLALTVAGCFIVFSATRTRTADPYTFVTRQVIFAIVAARRHGRRDGRRLRVVEGPRPRPVRADDRRALRARRRTAAYAGDAAAGDRRRPDPDPAGRVRQVRRAAGDVRLPQRRAPARRASATRGSSAR